MTDTTSAIAFKTLIEM